MALVAFAMTPQQPAQILQVPFLARPERADVSTASPVTPKQTAPGPQSRGGWHRLAPVSRFNQKRPWSRLVSNQLQADDVWASRVPCGSAFCWCPGWKYGPSQSVTLRDGRFRS